MTSSEKISINYEGNKGPLIGTRHVQTLLVSFGQAIIMATKSSFSVAIVAMTDSTSSSNPNVPSYDWTNTSIMVSSILWSGVAVNLLAGYLGRRYGPKWLLAGTYLNNGIFFLLIPQAAQIGGSGAVIACRALQGISLGCLFPLNAVVHARWTPPEERSRLGFIGSGVVIVLGMLASTLSGYIAASSFGWPLIFYSFGSLGVFWSAIYMIFGSQSPESHRNIDSSERTYLTETLRGVSDKDGPVPWRKMFSAMPFWAIIIGQIGQYCIWIMMSTEMNIFLANVMKFNIKQNGVLSSTTFAAGMLSGTVLSILSDFAINRNLLSIVNARRLFHLTGITGMSICLITITYIPVDYRAWSIVLLCLGQAFLIACNVGGTGINILDVSPKFAGVIMGVAQMVSQTVSIFGPLVVQWVCTDLSSAFQWRIVFVTTGSVAVGTGIFFAVFASGERQAWDNESEDVSQKTARRKKSSVISAVFVS